MKMIIAYIQPFMLEKVADALRINRIHGTTVTACEGFGKQTNGEHPHYLDQEIKMDFAEKRKIEIICLPAQVADIVKLIRENARTGHHGDGKIFVLDVGNAVDIRTGESGESVIR